jgi:MFS family permease
VFGSLATILSVKFFDPSHPAAALVRWLAIFAIGFFVRPLGALVLGRVGDLVGRKYTFLITLSGMGISTALIGVVPTYAVALVLSLRMMPETRHMKIWETSETTAGR